MPIEVSRAAVSATPDAELVTIPGAAHGFGDANWEEAMRRTIGFLAWNGVLEEDERSEPRGEQRERAAQPVYLTAVVPEPQASQN